MNTFNANIDVIRLYKLSFGFTVESELAESILIVKMCGGIRPQQNPVFHIEIHNPIKKQKLQQNAGKTVVVKGENGKRIDEVSRNIIGKLKKGRSIDFERALTYPLCPRGVMVKAMNCGIVVREFVLQSLYYVHFRANTLGKGMNPLILPPAMGK